MDTKITDVSQAIIDFEKVVQEYHDDYGTYCLTEDTCKDTLRQIIPDQLERAINLALVGVQDKDGKTWHTKGPHEDRDAMKAKIKGVPSGTKKA